MIHEGLNLDDVSPLLRRGMSACAFSLRGLLTSRCREQMHHRGGGGRGISSSARSPIGCAASGAVVPRHGGVIQLP